MCHEEKIFFSLSLVNGPRSFLPSSFIRVWANVTSYAIISNPFLWDSLEEQNTYLLGQVPRIRDLRYIWQDKKSTESHRKRDDSINDEQPIIIRQRANFKTRDFLPLPSPKSVASPKSVDSIHQITRKHTGNTAARVENT